MDGWNDDVQAACEDFLRDVEQVAYEIRNCVRGGYTNVTDNAGLAEIFEKLAEQAGYVADNIANYCEEQSDGEEDNE